MRGFTPCELEVMQILWEQQAELKPAEILARMDRPLTNAALRSTIRVLMQKGHVTRRKRGKAYYYRPKRSASTVFKRMSRRLAEVFFGGSSYKLIAELVKTEKLSVEDVRQLQELAKEEKVPRQ